VDLVERGDDTRKLLMYWLLCLRSGTNQLLALGRSRNSIFDKSAASSRNLDIPASLSGGGCFTSAAFYGPYSTNYAALFIAGS